MFSCCCFFCLVVFLTLTITALCFLTIRWHWILHTGPLTWSLPSQSLEARWHLTFAVPSSSTSLDERIAVLCVASCTSMRSLSGHDLWPMLPLVSTVAQQQRRLSANTKTRWLRVGTLTVTFSAAVYDCAFTMTSSDVCQVVTCVGKMRQPWPAPLGLR